MTNRQRLCFAIIAYLIILAMGGGALYALQHIKPSRDGIAQSNK